MTAMQPAIFTRRGYFTGSGAFAAFSGKDSGNSPDIWELAFNLLSATNGPPITYTNTTGLNVIDGFGQLVQVAANSPAFDGMRVATYNFLNALTLSTQTVAVKGGTWAIAFYGAGSVTFSGVGSGVVTGVDAVTRKTAQVTVTTGNLVCTVAGNVTFATIENVTGQANQAPSEPPAVDHAAVTTIWFPYQNPWVVNTGVATDSGVRAMLAPGKGSVLWPPGTNLYTGYSTPGEDQFRAELSSGATVVGKVYQITAQLLVDRTLAGAANNNVGTEYVCTLAQTNTAADKVKEKGGTNSATGAAVSGLGTGAVVIKAAGVWTGGVIPGLTFDGGNNGDSISIANDITAVGSAGLLDLNPSGKVYKLTCTAPVGVNFIGNVANSTSAHSVSLYTRGSLVDVIVCFSDAGSQTTTAQITSYTRKSTIGIPASTLLTGRCYFNSGTHYFIIAQTENSPTPTSPIITNGATNTRGYTSFTVPETMGATGYRPRSFEFTPRYLSTTPVCIEDNYTDALNWNRLWANTQGVMYEKRVAGVSTFACCYTTLAAGSTYLLKRWFNPDNTVGVSVNGVAGLSGLGSELITDPGFDNSGLWTKTDASITVSGGKGRFSSTPSGNALAISVESAGKIFTETITIDSITGTMGTNNISGGWAGLTAPGTYSKSGFALSSFAGFTAQGVLTAVIDNYSSKLINNNTDSTSPVIAGTTRIGSATGGVSVVDGWIKNERTN